MKENEMFEIVKAKAQGMEAMIADFKVTNDQELELVADRIKDIKTLMKFIKAKKDEFVAPAKVIIENAKEMFDPYIKQCENGETTLKMRAVKYNDEQEKKRKEDEIKIASKVETGYIKPETAIEKIEALPEVQKTVRTDKGSGLSFAKRKVAVIEKPDIIPDEFWIIDEVRVRKEALTREKNGEEQIPGVVIKEETSASSR